MDVDSNYELMLVKLKDCFTAGYLFTNFCKDYNISKPLFISSSSNLLWAIRTQFNLSKLSIQPSFFINGNPVHMAAVVLHTQTRTVFENYTTIKDANEYDAILIIDAESKQNDIIEDIRKKVNSPVLRSTYLTILWIFLQTWHMLKGLCNIMLQTILMSKS